MVRVEYVCAWGSRKRLRAKAKSGIQKNCVLSSDMRGNLGSDSVRKCQKMGEGVVLC